MSLSGPSVIEIPFKIPLEVGQNNFKLSVPRRHLDSDMDYRFGFSFLTLIPEYYSQQALRERLDPVDEGDRDIEYPFEVDFVFGENYLLSGPTRQFSQSADVVETGTLIRNINTHFSRLKPSGANTTLLVLDWFVDGWEQPDNPISINEFHKVIAAAAYDGAVYEEAKHGNSLPLSSRDNKALNNLMFPTTKVQDFLDRVRVRMLVAPNTRVAFSNDSILKHLGFAAEQIPEKVNKQINFINNYSDAYTTFIGTLGQKFATTEGKNSKITLYPVERVQSLRGRIVKTSRLSEIEPQELIHDVSEVIEDMAIDCNQRFAIRFSRSTNRFLFLYPENPSTRVVMHMSPRLAKLLGFHATHTVQSPTQPDVIKPAESSTESEQKARTLVYDIGMAWVNLEEYFSESTSQFATTSMASLEADYSGTMTTRHNHKMASVNVTYFKPDLEFRLYRFNEKGFPAPLNLPCSAYIQGVFCGTSIKVLGGLPQHR